MRARIDISELEAETKIRAKYLRALENEEWDLLPGPTYVKSFLREYADALGLDGKLLVEEYKLRHERPSDFELQPISPRSQRQRQRDRGRRRAASSGARRDVAVAVDWGHAASEGVPLAHRGPTCGARRLPAADEPRRTCGRAH